VQRVYVRQDGDAQWYIGKAGISRPRDIAPTTAIDEGWLVVVGAKSGGALPPTSVLDVTDTGHAYWNDYFGQTASIGSFAYSFDASAPVEISGDGIVTAFDPAWILELNHRSLNLAADRHTIAYSFVDADDNPVFAIQTINNDTDYITDLYYGPSLSSMTSAPRTGGAYTQAVGTLQFFADRVEYTDSGGHADFTINCLAHSIVAIRVVSFTSRATNFANDSYSGGTLEIVGRVEVSDDIVDMNPAHIIRECLTDPDWGMGYADADIDDVSFEAAADTLYDEDFGLSLIWDKQMSIEDFVKEVLRHIDATLFVNRATGTFTLKLIRDDYDPNTLLELDESNVERVEDFSRRSFDELYNSATVKYVDNEIHRDAAVEVQDIAQIQIQNAVINTTMSYVGISNGTLAGKVAARDLRAMSSPIASCTIYASTVAKDLTIGDTFKLTWPDYDLVDLVMRVAGISYGDGVNNTVRIQATQDVFSAPDVTYVAVPVVDWDDISGPPTPTEFQLAFEAPYYELVQQLGQATADSTLATNADAGYVGVAAVQPGGAINAVLSTDAGAGYVEAGAFNFCPSATIATDLTKSTVSVVLADGVSLSSVTAGSHAQLNDEILVVVSIVGTTFTFERGALDTVPTEHTSGDRVFFWSEYFGSDPTEYSTGETVAAKVLPITGQGQLSLIFATPLSVTLDQRALRPYPPGNFQLGGLYFPLSLVDSFDVTWAHRDRTQQTSGAIESFLDGDIGPEAGVTYNGYAYDNDTGTLLDSTTGVTGTLWSPAVTGAYTLRIETESERGGLVSWQRQSCTFDFIGTDGRATDDEDYRVTDDGALRILD
jgi:Putative phage tail protein